MRNSIAIETLDNLDLIVELPVLRQKLTRIRLQLTRSPRLRPEIGDVWGNRNRQLRIPDALLSPLSPGSPAIRVCLFNLDRSNSIQTLKAVIVLDLRLVLIE